MPTPLCSHPGCSKPMTAMKVVAGHGVSHCKNHGGWAQIAASMAAEAAASSIKDDRPVLQINLIGKQAISISRQGMVPRVLQNASTESVFLTFKALFLELGHPLRVSLKTNESDLQNLETEFSGNPEKRLAAIEIVHHDSWGECEACGTHIDSYTSMTVIDRPSVSFDVNYSGHMGVNDDTIVTILPRLAEFLTQVGYNVIMVEADSVKGVIDISQICGAALTDAMQARDLVCWLEFQRPSELDFRACTSMSPEWFEAFLQNAAGLCHGWSINQPFLPFKVTLGKSIASDVKKALEGLTAPSWWLATS